MWKNVCLFMDNLLNYFSWLNEKAADYEKLIIVFSGLASAFAAIIAIIISLRNSKQQKEIQLRQIKLESYNIKTNQLSYLFVALNFIEKLLFAFGNGMFLTLPYERISKTYKDCHEFDVSIQDLVIELYKIKYSLPKENLQDFNNSIIIFSNSCNSFSIISAIVTFGANDKDELFKKYIKLTKKGFYQELMESLKNLKKEFQFVQNVLEKDINIYNIQKI